MVYYNFNFNQNDNNKKITANCVIENLFITQSKENQKNMLDAFAVITNFDADAFADADAIKICINQNNKKSLLKNIKICFNDFIYNLIASATNTELRKIIFKTFANDYKLIKKLKSKFDNLSNYQIDEKTNTYKSICKSFILAIFNVYKLQILQVIENDIVKYCVCDYDSWQTLLKNSYNQYMQQLKMFFADGGATNNTPEKPIIAPLQ